MKIFLLSIYLNIIISFLSIFNPMRTAQCNPTYNLYYAGNGGSPWKCVIIPIQKLLTHAVAADASFVGENGRTCGSLGDGLNGLVDAVILLDFYHYWIMVTLQRKFWVVLFYILRTVVEVQIR